VCTQRLSAARRCRHFRESGSPLRQTRWIPAPRLRGGKLRGYDGVQGCRRTGRSSRASTSRPVRPLTTFACTHSGGLLDRECERLYTVGMLWPRQGAFFYTPDRVRSFALMQPAQTAARSFVSVGPILNGHNECPGAVSFRHFQSCAPGIGGAVSFHQEE